MSSAPRKISKTCEMSTKSLCSDLLQLLSESLLKKQEPLFQSKALCYYHNWVKDNNFILCRPSVEEDVLDFGSLPFPSRSRYSSEFETVGYISKGGFGEVYKVKNKLDGQEYAIKKIHVR